MRSRRSTWLLFFIAVASLLVLARAECRRPLEQHAPPTSRASRDWNTYPAIVERDTPAEIVAVGDIHGGFERLVKLLVTGGLVQADATSPVGYRWTGGSRVLVCPGDVIDKGDRSLEAIDLLNALEPQARASGGAVIVTLGNHEVSFLADPDQKKARAFRDELARRGLDPHNLNQDGGPGRWLLNRPVAARVNDWFFSHAGETRGQTLKQLFSAFRTAFEQGDWRSPLLLGPESLLEAREWWKGDSLAERLDRNLQALGVRHLVIGHDPAHDGRIRVKAGSRLFMIDTGMSPAVGYGEGALLLVDTLPGEEIVSSLGADGIRVELWRGATPGHANSH